jgi:hypothetical protein
LPGLPTPDPERSVFINCPFDLEYEPLFDALLFTTVCCGFYPRSSIESSNIDVPRMERIAHAIFTSKYSIHDLSRCRGEGEGLFARFNMPLELGMAIGRRLCGIRHGERHDWLVLVPEGRRYWHFVSDLAGYDLKEYDGSTQSIVPRVMAWLVTQHNAIDVARPPRVLQALLRFRESKASLKLEWAGHTPWNEIVSAASRAVPRI